MKGTWRRLLHGRLSTIARRLLGGPQNDEYNTLGYVRETPIFMKSTDWGWIRVFIRHQDVGYRDFTLRG